jgi:hypothetical protein
MTTITNSRRPRTKTSATVAAPPALPLQIQAKSGRLEAYKPNRIQAAFLRERSGRDLILKARQVGISTAIQADYFATALHTSALVVTLAHDAATTARLRRMASRFYEHLPADVKPPRGADNATVTTYPQSNSEVTFVTAGNVTAGRGGTYTHVHGSEVAFWDDASAIMAGVLQGVTANGLIALESTPNGARGWFYERCLEALDGADGWKLHFFPWWRDRSYQKPLKRGEALHYSDEEAALVDRYRLTARQIAWRRAKQRELRSLFAQEYPEDVQACFLLSGLGYFGDLGGVFCAPFGAEPQAGHRYVAGLDFGQMNDYTVLSVIDATTGQQVDLLRLNRLPWAMLRERIVGMCRQWQVALVCAESNAAGAPNIEALLAAGLRLEAFATTAASKPPLVAGLHEALHSGALALLDLPEQVRELASFTATQTPSGHWTYGGSDREHDDTVIANALAWRAAMTSGPFILFGDRG